MPSAALRGPRVTPGPVVLSVADLHRHHARRLRELYGREQGRGNFGTHLLLALARVRERLAVEAEVVGSFAPSEAALAGWAGQIGSEPRRPATEWESWLARTFGSK